MSEVGQFRRANSGCSLIAYLHVICPGNLWAFALVESSQEWKSANGNVNSIGLRLALKVLTISAIDFSHRVLVQAYVLLPVRIQKTGAEIIKWSCPHF